MRRDIKVVLIGEKMPNRAFNGANKALPVLASSLNNAGYTNVRQLDMEREDMTLDEVMRETRNSDLIGISGVSTQLDQIYSHAKKIREDLEGRKTPIIVGGYAAKGAQEIAANAPWITAFFNGEGEEGILQIAGSVARDKFDDEKKKIKGLCYVDSSGNYHESLADRVRDLDGIDQNFGFVHVPKVHDMDIFRDDSGRVLKTAQLFDQRGCLYRCGFCNKSLEEKAVVHVGDEWFEELVMNLADDGYEAVYLDNDTATINADRFRKKMEILNEYGLKVGINTRIDIEARRLKDGKGNIEFAKNHGAIYQFFGVEHTDPNVLVAIGKFNGNENSQVKRAKQYKEDVKVVFTEMERTGLPSSYFLIMGLPKKVGEDYRPTSLEEDQEAIRFALTECNPNYLNFNVLRFMPGTTASDLPSNPNYTNPFACVRPTGDNPVSGVHFIPALARKNGYDPQEYHPIFQCFEDLPREQPRSTAVSSKRAYETMKYTIDLINQRIEHGKKPTTLFLGHRVLDKGLITREDNGKYNIVGFEQFN